MKFKTKLLPDSVKQMARFCQKNEYCLRATQLRCCFKKNCLAFFTQLSSCSTGRNFWNKLFRKLSDIDGILLLCHKKIDKVAKLLETKTDFCRVFLKNCRTKRKMILKKSGNVQKRRVYETKVNVNDEKTLRPFPGPNYIWRLFLWVTTKDLIIGMLKTT